MSASAHTELYYHFVWTTKNNCPAISYRWERKLYVHIVEKSKEYGYQVLAVGGTDDHVHYLMRAKPDMAPCDIAHKVKGSSSRFINQRNLCEARFEWQEGYGAFSVSTDRVPTIVAYIRRQRQHHADKTTAGALEVS